MVRQVVCAALVRSPERCRRVGVAIALGASCAGPVAASAEGSLSSPAIDYSIYRDGEVRRVEKRFEAWQLTCDEIKRLGRRFCSMRGVARSPSGTIIAALTVSTDEKGRPAALVRLPFGTVLASGVTFRRRETSPKRKAPGVALRPTLCDEAGCEVVWALDAGDIQTLTANQVVEVAFRMVRAPRVLGPLLADASAIDGTIQTAGFAAALKASFGP